jgi:hypothetical protein
MRSRRRTDPINALAISALALATTDHPTTYLLKISIITSSENQTPFSGPRTWLCPNSGLLAEPSRRVRVSDIRDDARPAAVRGLGHSRAVAGTSCSASRGRCPRRAVAQRPVERRDRRNGRCCGPQGQPRSAWLSALRGSRRSRATPRTAALLAARRRRSVERLTPST